MVGRGMLVVAMGGGFYTPRVDCPREGGMALARGGAEENHVILLP